MRFLFSQKSNLLVDGTQHIKTLHLGCHQGGVLSPFLWNLLVDGLLRLSFCFPIKFIGYADDITIVKSHKDPAIAAHNLQIFCDTVVKWLASRKLFVNPLQPFPTFSLANCQSDRTSKFS